MLAFADAFEVFDPEICDHVEGLCVREELMVANGRRCGLREGFSWVGQECPTYIGKLSTDADVIEHNSFNGER